MAWWDLFHSPWGFQKPRPHYWVVCPPLDWKHLDNSYLRHRLFSGTLLNVLHIVVA